MMEQSTGHVQVKRNMVFSMYASLYTIYIFVFTSALFLAQFGGPNTSEAFVQCSSARHFCNSARLKDWVLKIHSRASSLCLSLTGGWGCGVCVILPLP